MSSANAPVLILGAGINGAALARELVLRRVPVVLVDQTDIASGATAYSSRLIHGGLRYLEYAEFSLVAESLRERNLLLRLAADYVRPLRFFIPAGGRWQGLLAAANRFLHLPFQFAPQPRGRMVVQMGLKMYDWFAGGGVGMIPSQVHPLLSETSPGVPRVAPPRATHLLSYSDAQVLFPERFTIALLRDTAALAREHGVRFDVHTYHSATLQGDEVVIAPLRGAHNATVIRPRVVANATGAWIDHTLQRLRVTSPRLIGGTRGSHFLTFHAGLRDKLRGQAVYAEASDGRPVFVLPFQSGTLVGTTDIPFEGDPATAVATEAELVYLLSLVNSLFPDLQLRREDIALHGCGVRPLPAVNSSTTAAVTRRHQLTWSEADRLPVLSLIGGKLTTCRSFAEEAAKEICSRLSLPFHARLSRERSLPRETAIPEPDVFSSNQIEAVRFALRDEWATTLGDIVERRWMWLFHPHLTRASIEKLATAMVQCDALAPAERSAAIDNTCSRLATHYGRLLN